MKTVRQMRHDIIAVVNGEEPGGTPSYRDRSGFRKHDLVRVIEHVTGDSIDRGTDTNKLRFRLLQELDEDPDPFEAAKPLKKHRVWSLHEMVMDDA